MVMLTMSPTWLRVGALCVMSVALTLAQPDAPPTPSSPESPPTPSSPGSPPTPSSPGSPGGDREGRGLAQKGNTGRQYYNNDYYNGYNNNNQQQSYNNQNKQQYNNQNQQQYSTNSQQHSGDSNYLNSIEQNSHWQGYYDNYASDYGPEYAASSFTNTVADNPDSSPALSALALLGFLYFLNLIQDVLENNKRRKRDIDNNPMLKPVPRILEALEDTGVEYLEAEPVDDDMEQDIHAAAEPRGSEGDSEDFYEVRHVVGEDVMRRDGRRRPTFLESVMAGFSNLFGLQANPRTERLGVGGHYEGDDSMSVGGFLASRFRMVSSIMDFLSNPNPTRVKRSGRARRYTSGMNVWYDGLEGQNMDADVGGVAAKVTSLLGGDRELQGSVSRVGVKAMAEVAQGLVSDQKHCLQRAVCRLQAMSHQLSFGPRLALQLLSTNLLGEGEDAVQAVSAGRRGEDCQATFTECS